VPLLAIDRPASLDPARIALDRQLAIGYQVVAFASERGRAEADLGIALDVEELGRLKVRLDVLVLDDERRDVDGTAQLSRVLIMCKLPC
jgi:hypothetical protein